MDQSKPICKVRGVLAPNAVCGYVVVGMKYCGYNGECEHKREQDGRNLLLREGGYPNGKGETQ